MFSVHSLCDSKIEDIMIKIVLGRFVVFTSYYYQIFTLAIPCKYIHMGLLFKRFSFPSIHRYAFVAFELCFVSSP